MKPLWPALNGDREVLQVIDQNGRQKERRKLVVTVLVEKKR